MKDFLPERELFNNYTEEEFKHLEEDSVEEFFEE
jgi:hypothetical protein